jgi:hypothetical protein
LVELAPVKSGFLAGYRWKKRQSGRVPQALVMSGGTTGKRQHGQELALGKGGLEVDFP